MKYILLLVFSSCALELPQRTNTKSPSISHATVLKKCTDSFMKDHGVSIKDALDACKQIYRR